MDNETKNYETLETALSIGSCISAIGAGVVGWYSAGPVGGAVGLIACVLLLILGVAINWSMHWS
jgi:hypothetical protein